MMAPITGLPPRPWLVAASAALLLLVVGIGVTVTTTTVSGLKFPQLASLQGLSLMGGETISGKARALAAGTLRVGDQYVRLRGIEVPDPNQRCLRAGARAGGRTWACGEDAQEAMQRIVNGRTVTCEIAGRDSEEVVLGRCQTKGGDVAEALVKAGFAFAHSGLMSAYSSAEKSARESKSGIWGSAEPERPAQWRERLWAVAKRRAPDGCPIKGRVRGHERVYLLPWATNYSRVRIRKSRGERWFCTQDEAEAAGWHNSQSG
jgi:endonuclease YncB( thermonuclease family)